MPPKQPVLFPNQEILQKRAPLRQFMPGIYEVPQPELTNYEQDILRARKEVLLQLIKENKGM